MSWEQVLRYTRLQKRYISLYASLLKSDPSQVTISGNREIEDLDRELDIELILQWRYIVYSVIFVWHADINIDNSIIKYLILINIVYGMYDFFFFFFKMQEMENIRKGCSVQVSILWHV